MFDVAKLNFHRASDGNVVQGVCTALNENTREVTVVFAQNGLNWVMPYTEFFAPVKIRDNGDDRPEFMPLAAGTHQPFAFSDGERSWDPVYDTGMRL